MLSSAVLISACAGKRDRDSVHKHTNLTGMRIDIVVIIDGVWMTVGMGKDNGEMFELCGEESGNVSCANAITEAMRFWRFQAQSPRTHSPFSLRHTFL